MHDDSSSSAAVQTSVRRYWRRSETPGEGWWPWGWLPILGLLLTLLYGLFAIAPKMEAQTRESVASALTDSALPGFDVDVDGQRVVIRGEGTDHVAAQVAATARGAACDTWLADQIVCPTRVEVALATPTAAPTPTKLAAADSQMAAAPVAAAPPAVARLHDLSFIKDGELLRLAGEVPNEAARARLIADAERDFSTVIDELVVSGERATDNYDFATERAWHILGQIEDGGVAWSQGKLSAWGRAQAGSEASIRSEFSAPNVAALLGDLRLEVASSGSDECDRMFAETLSESTIEFRTGSASIAASSQPLLRRLAELAADCPIRLDVEGHTDNIGSEDTNRRLSLARAQAVIDALVSLGVDVDRLTPRGYGPSKPLADNATAEGRARNRRIEIRATASGG